jgi:hypothetical protein
MTRPSRFIVVAVGLIVAACSRMSAEAPTVAADAASLLVDVRDVESGVALTAASVRIVSAGRDTLIQHTDSTGRAEFAVVRPGSVEVVVSRIGYVAARREVDLTAGCRTRVNARIESATCPVDGCRYGAARMDVLACRSTERP